MPEKSVISWCTIFPDGLFVECSVLIDCDFPSGNFQLREIPRMHSE